jgi:hypothetical protein
MNINLVNDQHSALEISELSELTVHFSQTVAETASNSAFCITIIFPKLPKPCPM